jgi:thiamine-phosphate pyrophosphorylase
VAACEADGVHIGQDDGSARAARASVGPDRIVGRSTHAPEQAAAADADADVDYLAVGPVHATPTKPGRPAAGLAYVEWAAANVSKPWFAIGGLDAGNVGAVSARGATRIVVVRAVAAAADPEAAARVLRERLEAPLGAAQP